MTIYISPNPGKTSASEIALRAAQILLTHGAAVLMSDALRESCNTAQQEAIRAHGTWETSHYQLEQTKLRCQEQQQERATLEQMRQQGTEKQQQLQESLRQTEQNIAQTRADLDMQQGQRAAFQQQQAELAEQRAALRIQAF